MHSCLNMTCTRTQPESGQGHAPVTSTAVRSTQVAAEEESCSSTCPAWWRSTADWVWTAILGHTCQEAAAVAVSAFWPDILTVLVWFRSVLVVALRLCFLTCWWFWSDWGQSWSLLSSILPDWIFEWFWSNSGQCWLLLSGILPDWIFEWFWSDSGQSESLLSVSTSWHFDGSGPIKVSLGRCSQVYFLTGYFVGSGLI